MKKILCVAICAVLASCTADDVPFEADAGVSQTLTERCGEVPPAPYFPVTNTNGRAEMSSADWELVVVFRDKVQNWAACAKRHSENM